MGGLVSSGLGLLGSIGGSLISGSSSGAETSAIQAGAAQANKADQAAYSQVQSELSPYTSTGATAENQLGNLTGLNGQAAANNAFSTFQASPGYQYQVSQGLKGIDQGAAAKGMLQSGGTMQAEQTLGNNLANQSFDDYYNKISGLASSGLSATNTVASAGVSTAHDQASTDASEASALAGINANAGAAQGSILQNGLTNLGANSSGLISGANQLFGSGDSTLFGGGGGGSTSDDMFG